MATFERAKDAILPDYSSHSILNMYHISKITIEKKVHCYCRLGGDVYTNNIVASFDPGDRICDYVYLDKAIEDTYEATDSLIEEVVNGIVYIILAQCPEATNIHVESTVTDSVPKNMPVKVEIDL